MITVKVEGLKQVARSLGEAGKQARFAAAVALTRTAKDGAQVLRIELSSQLSGSSPYSLRSAYSTSARASDLSSLFGIKDKKPAGGTAPATLLKEHFTGGARGNKPYEKALAGLGALPSGWRAIPAEGIKKDRYGNPLRREVGEVLGALKAGINIYKGRGKRMALTGYFVVPVGARSHLVAGVYKRIGARVIKPMFVFVRQAGYRRAFDLARIGSDVVGKRFNGHFAEAFKMAMSTAR
jgi:hypothetical protein